MSRLSADPFTYKWYVLPGRKAGHILHRYHTDDKWTAICGQSNYYNLNECAEAFDYTRKCEQCLRSTVIKSVPTCLNLDPYRNACKRTWHEFLFLHPEVAPPTFKLE